jgi:hypothetical protein
MPNITTMPVADSRRIDVVIGALLDAKSHAIMRNSPAGASENCAHSAQRNIRFRLAECGLGSAGVAISWRPDLRGRDR